MLGVLIGILVCFIVMNIFLMVVEIVNYKADVKYLMRAYMLQMETEGYLSVENTAAFKQELTERGVINIDLTGTTSAPAGYGQKINLCLKANIPVEILDTSSADLFSYFWKEHLFEIEERMLSTAKH